MPVRRAVAAATFPLLLLVSACSGGEEAPDRPAYAEQGGRAGAERFAGYWADTLERASLTGNTKRLRSLSTPACATCTGFADQIDAIYGDGGSVRTGGYDLTSVVPERGSDGETFRLMLTLVVEPQTVVRSRNAEPEKFTGGERNYRMILKPRSSDQGWVVQRLSAR